MFLLVQITLYLGEPPFTQKSLASADRRRSTIMVIPHKQEHYFRFKPRLSWSLGKAPVTREPFSKMMNGVPLISNLAPKARLRSSIESSHLAAGGSVPLSMCSCRALAGSLEQTMLRATSRELRIG